MSSIFHPSPPATKNLLFIQVWFHCVRWDNYYLLAPVMRGSRVTEMKQITLLTQVVFNPNIKMFDVLTLSPVRVKFLLKYCSTIWSNITIFGQSDISAKTSLYTVILQNCQHETVCRLCWVGLLWGEHFCLELSFCLLKNLI